MRNQGTFLRRIMTWLELCFRKLTPGGSTKNGLWKKFSQVRCNKNLTRMSVENKKMETGMRGITEEMTEP